MEPQILTKRRAIGALRAGVPNRDVVRHLPLLQANLKDKFERLLDSLSELDTKAKSMLIRGDFGTGKSHCLEYFVNQALERNFVCSRVVISKESPLFDLSKIYRKCLEAACVRDKTGSILHEIALKFNRNSDEFRKFGDWVESQVIFDQRLAASVLLFEFFSDQDEEMNERIILEWMGYPMKTSVLREGLRKLGKIKQYQIGKPKKDQYFERFQFIARFFKSAGYNGWIILLDEGELIGRFSLRQRAKAYANLSFLLGTSSLANSSDFGTVVTFTGDFDGEVLRGGKLDADKIPMKLAGSRDAKWIEPSISGMDAILHRSIDLQPVTKEVIEQNCETIQGLYSDAYAWSAPHIEVGEVLGTQSMRHYIRSWINRWDLLRLYGHEAEISSEKLVSSYEEDADLEKPSDNEAEEG